MALTSKFLRPSQANEIDETAGTRYIAALKFELAGYVAQGNTERANAVRAELARVTREDGAVETATAEPDVERAVKPKTRKRSE